MSSSHAKIQQKTRLVEQHLPLVKRIAERYRTRHTPVADLVGEGTVALLLAAESFAPDRDGSFIAYARRRIRWSIRRATQLRDAVDHRVAAGADVASSAIEEVSDERTPAQDELASQLQIAKTIEIALLKLDPREEHVVRLGFGFDSLGVHAVAAIATALGIHPTQVERIQARALAKLRRWLADTADALTAPAEL